VPVIQTAARDDDAPKPEAVHALRQEHRARVGALHGVLRERGEAESLLTPADLDGMPRPRSARSVTLTVEGPTETPSAVSYTEHTEGPDGYVSDTIRVVVNGDDIIASSTTSSRHNNAGRPAEAIVSDNPRDVAEALDVIERASGITTGSVSDEYKPLQLQEKAMRKVLDLDADLEASGKERAVLARLATRDGDPYGYGAQAAAAIRNLFSTADKERAYGAVASFALAVQDGNLLQESMDQLPLAERWRVIAQAEALSAVMVPPAILEACMVDLEALEARSASNPANTSEASTLLDIYASQLDILLREGDNAAIRNHLAKLLPIAAGELKAQFLRAKAKGGITLTLTGFEPLFISGEEYYGQPTQLVIKMFCSLSRAGRPRTVTSLYKDIVSRIGDRRAVLPAYEAYAPQARLHRLHAKYGVLQATSRYPGDIPRAEVDYAVPNSNVLRHADPWSYVAHLLPRLILGPQAQSGEEIPVERAGELSPEDLTALMRTGDVRAIQRYYEALVCAQRRSERLGYRISTIQMALFLAAQARTPRETARLNNSQEIAATATVRRLQEEAALWGAKLATASERSLEPKLQSACAIIDAMPFSNLKIAYALEVAAITQRYSIHTPAADSVLDRLLHRIWSVAVATLPSRGELAPLPDLWRQLNAVGFSRETFYRLEAE
jgi:hypothetical protein